MDDRRQDAAAEAGADGGHVKVGSVAAMTTREAQGTPAIPLDMTISISSRMICCATVISAPRAWAMNSTATVQDIIEPSRLNE